MKRYSITVNGKAYDVTVDDDDATLAKLTGVVFDNLTVAGDGYLVFTDEDAGTTAEIELADDCEFFQVAKDLKSAFAVELSSDYEGADWLTLVVKDSEGDATTVIFYNAKSADIANMYN